ncbi:response regulator transcription factor [Bacillus cytotoxicus]|uniref:response regulator transcription factor n=1 Tax=Bacillus cereus group TaxID=86661 RepID=UPI000B26230A|nr:MULTISPECIES: response regulator transcription factor [Bacillus cereus group]AWC34450.1 DNA-binding response regulator [Bacillus cytotoxicus]AWC38448.1 DNA-binding response regulator [Bacillus cytotoxicus]AWC62666.1 DNA-binding response regulator [Bacillus cytotoxicus]QTR70845.1 response regulator transcription factor [Bacillus cytotoxicus]QTR79693.1 response regulator transcription factor [Bacillus cytotoxicus]
MAATILVVDDEEDILTFLADSLAMEGYHVRTALNGQEALRQLDDDVSLVLLDVMLPDMNGFEVCEKIRKSQGCPILFVSADSREQSRIEGLMIGGDDYISKPFSLKELKARIIANLRRTINREENKQVLKYGNIFIDLQSYEVRSGEQLIHFTKKEFEIVKILALHAGQVLTKEQLFEKIWGYDSESDVSTVVEHMKKIRTKISMYDKEYTYIQTVWGIGYKWSVQR